MRQNYSFDNGNRSDEVYENHFLGQMCQQIQNMSAMPEKKLKEITGLFQTQTQTHFPQQIRYMIPSAQPTPLQTHKLRQSSRQIKSTDPVINKTKMHCFYTNCDSLLNKREELETRMLTSEVLICGITEILTKNCVSKPTSNDFVMKDYNLYSNIDNYSIGRGVSIYVHKTLKSTESKFHFNKDYLESVLTEIKLFILLFKLSKFPGMLCYVFGSQVKYGIVCFISGSDTLLCGVIYKSQKVKENDLLDDLFLSVCNDKRYIYLLIMGDFNYSQTDWLNWTSSECSDHLSTKFIETIRDNFLFQHVSTPTRFRQNQ